MPPALLIGIDLVARGHARRICDVANRTWRAGRSAATSVLTFPWSIGMSLTDPATAVTARAGLAHLMSRCAAETCWSAVSTSIAAPQKQRDLPSAICVGILQPASHIAYFHAVEARWYRYLRIPTISPGCTDLISPGIPR